MGLEIERKYLVTSDAWRAAADTGSVLQQGYLCREPGRTVRVRLAGDQAWLTIKGVTVGIARPEYEMHQNSIESFLTEARSAGASGN